jgi:hypothetical protein
MTKDEWRLFRYGLLTALLMALLLTPILVYYPSFPRFAAEALLGVIALGMFLLSKRRERGRKTK